MSRISSRGRTHPGPPTLNEKVGYILGGLYVLLGLAGFAVIGDTGFTGTDGGRLLIFSLNPLHNLVHIAIGVALVAAAAAGPAAARGVNASVGAVYLLVGAVGLFLVGGDLNILALNHPDNVLHFVTAGVLLSAAVRADTAFRHHRKGT